MPRRRHSSSGLSEDDQQTIMDAAALWKANLIYLNRGNYRWHHHADDHVPGAIPGRITPWNKTVKKHKVDLYELGKEMGFADRDYREAYLKRRRLVNR